jgi:phosphoserine phosphatase
MIKEVAWTIVVANAISQAQVEIYQLAANAEALVERQAQHQLVSNAQRHQTKADRVEILKELKVAEVEEIN